MNTRRPHQQAWQRSLKNGIKAYRTGRMDDAIELFNRTLSLHRNTDIVLDYLAMILFEQKEHRAALACMHMVARLHPDAPHLFNLAMTLRALRRHEDAVRVLKTARSLSPESADIINKLGLSLMNLLNYEEAIKCFEKVTVLDPDNVRAAYDLSTSHLTIGNYTKGWCEYESRVRLPNTMPERTFSIPRWDGQPLAGRILVHHEQGYGDMIQFVRFLQQVRARCEWLAIEAPTTICELFATARGVDEAIPSIENRYPKGYDAHILLGDLPGILNYDALSSTPVKIPYLDVSRARRERMARLLAPLGSNRLRIGIVWAGGTVFELDNLRSLSLDHFLPLMEIPGISLVSLQYGTRSQDLPDLGVQGLIFDMSPHLQNFSDTAAAIKHLDLIISCDTSVAHLAGALDKPVWILLRYCPDWRWMIGREDSPWYPSARLFRQERAEDWTAPMRRIVKALHQMIAEPPRQEVYANRESAP